MERAGSQRANGNAYLRILLNYVRINERETERERERERY
jgi:hypothetical protein